MRRVIAVALLSGVLAAPALVAAIDQIAGPSREPALGSDRSMPPVEVPADGFTLMRLDGPVTVDGRNWNAAASLRSFSAPNQEFTIALVEPNEDGDVTRYRLAYSAPNRSPVDLMPHVVSYALVSPDVRWIVIEPADVIDVRTWRRYAVSKSLGLQPYVVPVAWSTDGRRLVISRQACAADCRGVPMEYYLIGFPAE